MSRTDLRSITVIEYLAHRQRPCGGGEQGYPQPDGADAVRGLSLLGRLAGDAHREGQ